MVEAALLLPLAAARAEQPSGGGPVRLSDHELEEVSAGDGSLLDLNVFLHVMLKNIAVPVNVPEGVRYETTVTPKGARDAPARDAQETREVISKP